MSDLQTLQEAHRDLEIRVFGLQYALEESVPQLVGALVVHLAKKKGT